MNNKINFTSYPCLLMAELVVVVMAVDMGVRRVEGGAGGQPL